MDDSVSSNAPGSLFPTDAPEPGGARVARYARVAIQRPLDSLEDPTLTYASPDEDLAPGELVSVPLGRARKAVEGVVIATAPASDSAFLDGLSPTKIRPIAKRHRVTIPPRLLELGVWIAQYYASPLGPTLTSMLPGAVRSATGERTREVLALPDPAPDIEPSSLTPKAREALAGLALIPLADWPIEPKPLAQRLGLSSVAPLNKLVALGALVRTERKEVRSRAEPIPIDASPDTPPTPTPDQQRVIDGVIEALGGFSVHLLRGVTGSGKTEVYLRIIERALDMGMTALVLVPEIALTPQTTRRFIARFSRVGVAVMHSAMPASERHLHWQRARAGEARVVVGARSALFAPLADLGVIIVDEEHDSSYKQDSQPRYHARDAAIKRAQIEGATILLGSATPSLESYANTQTDPPRATLWKLDTRAAGKLPEVRLVDTSLDPRRTSAGEIHPIGERLAREISATLVSQKQTILLLNRRGHSTYLGCPSATCGWKLCCESCDATLTLHKDKALPKGEIVRCHHCLAEQLAPGGCPVCARRVIRLGVGVQKIERYLEEEFGLALDIDYARVDSDSMRSARDYFSVLDRFARGDLKLLLGTQMLAKGLDFPGVRLVGVIDADTALHLPDFRAAERTFQLVSQVAGRAGRAGDDGLVIVQTLSPTNPAIELAARHDYQAFASTELRLRIAERLPPSWRMARIITSAPQDDDARIAAEVLEQRLARLIRPPARIEHTAPCVLARLSDRFRWEFRLIAPTASLVQQAITAWRTPPMPQVRARIAVDVDPVNLL